MRFVVEIGEQAAPLQSLSPTNKGKQDLLRFIDPALLCSYSLFIPNKEVWED